MHLNETFVSLDSFLGIREPISKANSSAQFPIEVFLDRFTRGT